MIKPEHTPFVFFWWVKISTVLTILALGAFLGCRAFSLTVPTSWFLVPWAVIILLLIFARPAAYRKEQYDFLDDKLVRQGGGLLSDSRSEIIARNITNVAVTRPWVERHLFGTGTVVVQAAGGAAVVFRNVADPDKIYAQVQQLMRKNGFQLQQKDILQTEKPSPIGILLEMLGQVFGILLVGIFTGGSFIMALLVAITLKSNVYATLLLALLIAVAIYIIIRTCLSYLDKRRRTYTAYADKITYSDGFLTTNDAFIPVENLSDVQTNQGLLSRILGIYDVIISCQGGGQEISFSNMENGEAFRKTVEQLLLTKKKRPDVKVKNEAPAKAVSGSAFTAQLQMHRQRVTTHWLVGIGIFTVIFIVSLVISISTNGITFLLPLVISPILAGLCGFMAIFGFVNFSASSYTIKQTSVEATYKFFAKTVTEFSMDKITGVVVREGIMDRWYGTQTIEFWSVGSTSTLAFKHIKKEEGIIPAIFSKLGIKPESVTATIRPEASIWRMTCSQAVLHLVFVGAIITSLIVHPPQPFTWMPTVALLIIATVRIIIFKMGVPKMKLTMFSSYVTFERGIWQQEKYLVQNEDIKSITSIRYPMTSAGLMRFDVAGEHTLVEGKSGTVSNGFTIPYLASIETQSDMVDALLVGKRNTNNSPPLIMASPNIVQTLWFRTVFVTAIGVVIWWYAALLDEYVLSIYIAIAATFIILSIVWALARTYSIRDDRIIERYGLIFRKRKSILFVKIDTIEQQRGPVNKLFNTGKIFIRTTGSAGLMPEMNVRNIRDHQRFYDVLRKEYR